MEDMAVPAHLDTLAAEQDNWVAGFERRCLDTAAADCQLEQFYHSAWLFERLEAFLQADFVALLTHIELVAVDWYSRRS
jgi:hypothetical protein